MDKVAPQLLRTFGVETAQSGLAVEVRRRTAADRTGIGQTKNGVCDIQTADGSFDVYVHVGFEAEDARLTLDDSGYAYVCGTDRDNGQNITAVVRVDLDAGEAPVKR